MSSSSPSSSSSSSSSSSNNSSSKYIVQLVENLLGDRHGWCILGKQEVEILTTKVTALVKVVLKDKQNTVLRTESAHFRFPNRGALTQFRDTDGDFHDRVLSEFNNQHMWFDRSHNRKETIVGVVEKEVDEKGYSNPSLLPSIFDVETEVNDCRNGFYELYVCPEGSKQDIKILMFVPCELYSLPDDHIIEQFVQQAYKEYAKKALHVQENGGDDGDLATVLIGRGGGLSMEELTSPDYRNLHVFDTPDKLKKWIGKPCLIYHEGSEKLDCLSDHKAIQRHNQEHATRCDICASCGKLKPAQV